MNQQTMMHLGTELVLFCGLFYYTSKTMSELKKEISELRDENQELRDYVDQNRPISGAGITAQQIQQLIQNALNTQSKDLIEVHQADTQQLQDHLQSERNKWEQREQEYRIQLAQYDQKLQLLEKKLEKKIKAVSSHPSPPQSHLSSQPPHQSHLSSQPPHQPQSSHPSPHPSYQSHQPPQPSSHQQAPPQAFHPPRPPSYPAPQQYPQQSVSPKQAAMNVSVAQGLPPPAITLPFEMFGIHMGPPPQRTSSVIIEEESEDEKSDNEEIEIELEVDEELERIQKEVERSMSKRKSKSRK